MTKDKNGKILIVDDNEDLLKAAKMFLKRHFAQIDLETNPEAIPNILNNESYDVILLDMNFTKDVSSGKEGFDWMERIIAIDPSAVVVLITAYGDVQMAVQAIKAGATDFVLKPWENDKLLATLYSAMQLRESKLEVKELKIRHLQSLHCGLVITTIGCQQALRPFMTPSLSKCKSPSVSPIVICGYQCSGSKRLDFPPRAR